MIDSFSGGPFGAFPLEKGESPIFSGPDTFSILRVAELVFPFSIFL